jgi:hypothetical protein
MGKDKEKILFWSQLMKVGKLLAQISRIIPQVEIYLWILSLLGMEQWEMVKEML